MNELLKLKARLDRQASLMNRMMRRLGVDAAAVADDAFGATLGAAARTCLLCGHDVECEAWLDTAPAGSRPPEFCPNGHLFRRLATEP